MARKISMQQLADRLGVSKYTVSQALAGKPGVSEATRREVTALAGALGYTIKPSASGDKEILEEKLVFIGLDESHDQEPSFWLRVREGLEAGCRLQGLQPKFFTFGAEESNAPELVPGGGVNADPDTVPAAAGFIIAGKCPLGMLLRLKRLGLPIVLADHEEPLIGADAVLNANAEAGRMACRHLLSQGCRRIVFIGRDSFAVSFRERWWGCRQALDDFKESSGSKRGGADANPVQLKKWTVPYGSVALSACQAAMGRKLEAAIEEGLPDGFVCANDDLALQLLELLRNRNLQDSVRVVGIDNTAAGMKAAVPLTTVDLAKETLGIRAVEAFARKLLQPEAQPEKIILAARLIVRRSG
ncbi:LacI family transcriptional regulator [Paenibacillus rhizovicinus]|uniref:LacI family transcriptional regulator n=1 Tax=Paenibacillus rhizovicinus TaxID=2704463 RepID=A0A6C0NWG2_9BACL|nr:LacI family DNA-binding transcriptional regulator [Paenibacillus rhizovicinus]QHW30498.1 LacI family transcriptional regulator [Paenibacillus rhizovicinus]